MVNMMVTYVFSETISSTHNCFEFVYLVTVKFMFRLYPMLVVVVVVMFFRFMVGRHIVFPERLSVRLCICLSLDRVRSTT